MLISPIVTLTEYGLIGFEDTGNLTLMAQSGDIRSDLTGGEHLDALKGVHDRNNECLVAHVILSMGQEVVHNYVLE